MQRVNVDQVNGAMILTLPQEVVAALDLREGGAVDLMVEDGTLILQKPRRSPLNLDDLLDKTDPRAFERTEEDWEWLNARPVGRELL